MISDRAVQILQAIVECYIDSGQPVASKSLASNGQLGLSSATIRNIMADLEAQGYLTSPHTSAGRIPTRRAYRMFVDNLLLVQQPSVGKLNELHSQLNPHSDTQVLIQRASQLLSDVTQLVSVVSMPRYEQHILRQVEFLPLSQHRLLVVLVLDDFKVQNRVIHIDQEFSRSELTAAGNYLTSHYSGSSLSRIREKFINDIQQQQRALEGVLQAVIEFTDELCGQHQDDCVVTGQRYLLNMVDTSDHQQLPALFEVFAQKRDILNLLNYALNTTGIQIVIGDESGYKIFDDYSLVTTTYTSNDKVVGVLGVIGPTRMAYRKVISAVDVTANLLSQSFGGYYV